MAHNQNSSIPAADILVVDDAVDSLRLLTDILTRSGYRVRPAERPQLALESALTHPPQLILLDVRMREMSGFEVCRRLKQDARTSEIPVIFVSALQDVEDRVQGFEAGGVDFVSKPYEEAEVLARVNTHLQLRAMQFHLEELVAARTADLLGVNAVLEKEVQERRIAQQALSESEVRFRATFEQAAVGIAHVAPDGHYLRLNQRFCDIAGYSHEEMVERTFQDITHPDDLDTDLEHLQRMLTGMIRTYNVEKRYFRKDGEIAWIDLTVSLVRDTAGEPDYFVTVVQDISLRKQAEQEILDYQNRLKMLAAELTLVEEQERRHIAAELHDCIGQSLALARIQLATARKATSDTRRKALLDDISRNLVETIQATRSLVFDLSSPLLNEIGLEAALSEWVEENLRSPFNLEVVVIDDEQDKPLSEDVLAIMFRNLRELLSNVVKHAEATSVCVRVERLDDDIRVSVADDGRGMDSNAALQNLKREGGFGLFSIQERMSDLGGSLQIVSRPGDGCTAILTLPLESGSRSGRM